MGEGRAGGGGHQPAPACAPPPTSPPPPPRSEDFTIHGLWPDRADGSWPQYCNDTARFTPASVDGLRARLAAAWPAFGGGGDAAFWRHEWLRHGTCAANGLAANETAYFARALALHESLPLLPALSAAGIAPSDTVARPHSVVVAALAKGLGAVPAVHCGGGRGADKVTEVWVCLAKDDLTPFDCPANVRSRRGRSMARDACKNVTLPRLRGGRPGAPDAGGADSGGGEPRSGWGGLDVSGRRR